MALAWPADLFQAVFKWNNSAGNKWSNVIKFHNDTGGDMEGAFGAWAGACIGDVIDLVGLCNVKTVLSTITLQALPPEGPLQSVTPLGLAGGVTGDGQAAQLAVEMFAKTLVPGPANNGRNWWSGWSESDSTGSEEPDNLLFTNLQEKLEALRVSAQGADVPWVIASFKNTTLVPVTNVFPSYNWRTQRRRAYR